MEAVLTEPQSEVSCVIIPLVGQPILLPNITVAEILPWRRVKAMEKFPPWCMGLLGWRGEAVPVVRYEAFVGDTAAANKTGSSLLVMNRSTATGPIFYAIAAEGLPRMLQLGAEDVTFCDANIAQSANNSKTKPEPQLLVQVGAEQVIIPDLAAIERALKKLPRA